MDILTPAEFLEIHRRQEEINRQAAIEAALSHLWEVIGQDFADWSWASVKFYESDRKVWAEVATQMKAKGWVITVYDLFTGQNLMVVSDHDVSYDTVRRYYATAKPMVQP